MSSKSQPQRPASSARVYDAQSSENSGSTGRRSKIPRLPKRTYSLEGKKSSTSSSKTFNSQSQASNFSLIPRLEWKKNYKKPSTSDSCATKKPITNVVECSQKKIQPEKIKKDDETFILNSSLQTKIKDDFLTLKNNVLRIPEYCTDAGQTLATVLNNSINIVKKKYPSADFEAFEEEVKNIVQTTETVKEKIFTKTENIIKQANKIYMNPEDDSEQNEEVLGKIKQESENLVMEVQTRKDVFGDLLKCSSEIMQLVDLEKILEKKVSLVKIDKTHQTSVGSKKLEGRQSSCQLHFSPLDQNLKHSYAMHSCGDVLRPSSGFLINSDSKPSIMKQKNCLENKFSQTTNLATAQLYMQEENLTNLNNLVLDLHQLCKDHISKFKSFNLQIKLRGICKKAQNYSSKEIQKHIDENLQLTEKNNRLQYQNKELEATLKQRDHNIQQKDRLIIQQKKLLSVRDELIEMLKSKCKIDETKL